MDECRHQSSGKDVRVSKGLRLIQNPGNHRCQGTSRAPSLEPVPRSEQLRIQHTRLTGKARLDPVCLNVYQRHFKFSVFSLQVD